MNKKIKIVASPNTDAECFDMVFEDGIEQTISVKLRILFQEANYRIKERRPDGQITIWEVHLPLGDTVTDDTLVAVDKLLVKGSVGLNCLLTPSH